MSDRPIIFSAPMVRALLDGRKTMTRRLAWRSAPVAEGGVVRIEESKPSPWQKVQPGDRLWVRENWQALSFGDYLPTNSTPADLRYAATGPLGGDDKDVRGYPWRPSIHMPRWASRLTLIVEAVKVEPLHDISPDDAVAEGLWYCKEGDAAGFWFSGPEMAGEVWGDGSVECFERLWSSLHGPESWDANPEVVALTFRVIRENIDRIKDAA